MLFRKKSVILAALIAAAIMVVPASYIISSDLNGHKTLPAISTSDSYASQSWAFNFDANDYNIANLSNESASFRQPEYGASFLNLSTHIVEVPFSGPSFGNERTPEFYFAFNVTGSIMASMLPTGVMVSYNSSLPPGPVPDMPFYVVGYAGDFGITNATEINVSGYEDWNGASHIIQLDNRSNNNEKNPYRFVFEDQVTAVFNGFLPNNPFTFDLNFTLLGLSKPVCNNMLIQLMDVNSTNSTITNSAMIISDSCLYDDTQIGVASVNPQSSHLEVTSLLSSNLVTNDESCT